MVSGFRFLHRLPKILLHPLALCDVSGDADQMPTPFTESAPLPNPASPFQRMFNAILAFVDIENSFYVWIKCQWNFALILWMD